MVLGVGGGRGGIILREGWGGSVGGGRRCWRRRPRWIPRYDFEGIRVHLGRRQHCEGGGGGEEEEEEEEEEGRGGGEEKRKRVRGERGAVMWSVTHTHANKRP